MFLWFNSKGLYQSSGKEKERCCLVLPSSTKREIRQFHVGNTRANVNLLFFFFVVLVAVAVVVA